VAHDDDDDDDDENGDSGDDRCNCQCAQNSHTFKLTKTLNHFFDTNGNQ